MLSTCDLLAVPCCSSSPPSCHTVVPHTGEERQEDDSMGWMFPALQLCQWLDFESCVCKGDLKVQLAATGMSVGMFLKTFSGLAFHHSVSHKHISSTQRCSSSYKWLSPTKAAVLWRLPNPAQPPSLREGSTPLLKNATTSNTGKATAFKHPSFNSIAMILFFQNSPCHLHFFIFTEVSSYNAYKYTNSFIFIFNKSFKPQRLKIFSTMVNFSLQVTVCNKTPL